MELRKKSIYGQFKFSAGAKGGGSHTQAFLSAFPDVEQKVRLKKKSVIKHQKLCQTLLQ